MTCGTPPFTPPDLFPPLTEQERRTVDDFSSLVERWTHSRRGGEGPLSVDWLGYVAQKSPLDLWIYQEILVETKPDLIIETGKCLGGSALYLATICELIGAGRIVSIDLVEQEGRPQHPRLSYVAGSSVDTHVVETVKSGVRPGDRIMVILDSDHHCNIPWPNCAPTLIWSRRGVISSSQTRSCPAIRLNQHSAQVRWTLLTRFSPPARTLPSIAPASAFCSR